MTIEALLIIVVFAAFCCYLVYRWQESAVDGNMAPPPYQEPVKAECPLGHTAVDKLEPTILNPKAAWPFPSGDKP